MLYDCFQFHNDFNGIIELETWTNVSLFDTFMSNRDW